VKDKKALKGASPVLGLVGHVMTFEQKTLLAIVKSKTPSKTAALGFGLVYHQHQASCRARDGSYNMANPSFPSSALGKAGVGTFAEAIRPRLRYANVLLRVQPSTASS